MIKCKRKLFSSSLSILVKAKNGAAFFQRSCRAILAPFIFSYISCGECNFALVIESIVAEQLCSMHNVYANHAHFRGQAERSLMLYIINSVSDLSTTKLLHGHCTVPLAVKIAILSL